MLVAEWMSTTVIKVEPTISVLEAIELQSRNDISILPVVQDEKLVGIITNVDLKPFRNGGDGADGAKESNSSNLRVEDIMSRAPVTIPVDFTVGEAAETMLKSGVQGLVVVDEEKRMVGVLTQTDLNRVLVAVTGLWHGGIAFGFLIEDAPGSIKVMTDIMRAYGGRLVSIVTVHTRGPKGYRMVHIRVRSLDRNRFDELLEELKTKGAILYYVDHRMNTRKVFPTAE